MTVKELKEQLDRYTDDLVIVLGYSAIEEDYGGNIVPEPVLLRRDVLYNSRGDRPLYVLRII